MSLKAVELQVALPRTLEAGRIQEHQLQRSIHEQQSLIDDRKELDQHMRQRPLDVQQTEKNQIRERERRQQQNNQEREGFAVQAGESVSSGEKTAPSIPMRDPMRGRFIDISL